MLLLATALVALAVLMRVALAANGLASRIRQAVAHGLPPSAVVVSEGEA